jgi:hypothetical protein
MFPTASAIGDESANPSPTSNAIAVNNTIHVARRRGSRRASRSTTGVNSAANTSATADRE